jgi:hypothetical protein
VLATLQSLFAKTAGKIKLEHRYLWTDIYRDWRRRFEEFAVPLVPLFVEAYVKDPIDLARSDERVWCLRSNVHSLLEQQQAFLNDMPGRQGLVMERAYAGRRGELRTLEALWQHRSNPEAIAAVLLSASLFSRLNKGHYPENWPAYAEVSALKESIDSHWEGFTDLWHLASTVVLPKLNRDFDYVISRHTSLIRYLAEEHASLLRLYAPLNVYYTQI